MSLNSLSLNVQGLNSPQKQVKVFRYLRKHRVNVACLQETHLSTSSHPKYFDACYTLVYQANGPKKQRGALVAFHKSTPVTCKKQIADPNGRYFLLHGLLQDTEVKILTHYAPNVNPGPFLTHICSLLGTLLMAGDSNLVLNPKLDKYPADISAPSADATKFLHTHLVILIWLIYGGNFTH